MVERGVAWRTRCSPVAQVVARREAARLAYAPARAPRGRCPFTVPERNPKVELLLHELHQPVGQHQLDARLGDAARDDSATSVTEEPSPSVTGAVTRSRPASAPRSWPRARARLPGSCRAPDSQARRYVLPALVELHPAGGALQESRAERALESALMRRLTVERGTPVHPQPPKAPQLRHPREEPDGAKLEGANFSVPYMGHRVPRAPATRKTSDGVSRRREEPEHGARAHPSSSRDPRVNRAAPSRMASLGRGHKVRAVTRDRDSIQAKSLAGGRRRRSSWRRS